MNSTIRQSPCRPIFRKSTAVWLAATFTLAWFSPVQAQQPAKVPRIGIVRGDPNAPAPSIKIFQQALQDLGYVEGRNIQFAYRYTEGNRDAVQAIVTELLSLNIDILFTTQAIVVRGAKRATKTTPIVMVITPDPVATGLVDSLARPGGNVTGLTSLARNLSGKRLELLTEMIPGLSQVGILSVAGSAASKDYDDAARALKVSLQPLVVRVPTPDLPGAFQQAVKTRVKAIIALSVPGLSGYRKQIIDLAVQNRLPLMSETVLAVNEGGLAFYGANQDEMYRRAAVIVDKILKGTKPADIPVEQPMKFDFVVNLKTAKQVGLTIPPEVLARATKIIR